MACGHQTHKMQCSVASTWEKAIFQGTHKKRTCMDVGMNTLLLATKDPSEIKLAYGETMMNCAKGGGGG